jgi:hypothetical protein
MPGMFKLFLPSGGCAADEEAATKKQPEVNSDALLFKAIPRKCRVELQ